MSKTQSRLVPSLRFGEYNLLLANRSSERSNEATIWHSKSK